MLLVFTEQEWAVHRVRAKQGGRGSRDPCQSEQWAPPYSILESNGKRAKYLHTACLLWISVAVGKSLVLVFALY